MLWMLPMRMPCPHQLHISVFPALSSQTGHQQAGLCGCRWLDSAQQLYLRAFPALPAHCLLPSPDSQGTGKLESVGTADWTVPTIDSWRHSIWVGVWDPWIVVFKGPRIWYKTVREIVTLERMHRAFADGLMT